MKIVCKKSNLLNGVQIVSKAVSSKTTMPILECILIDASNGEIKLTANDMELGIETIIEGDISEKGIIALDAKIFLEIVRKLPNNLITIETNSNLATSITCEKSKFDIVGKSGEDFSYLPKIEKNKSIVISQFTLKEIIRQTIFSISLNENNKMMTGELFEVKDNHLKVVSLDGHRISLRNVELKDNYDPIKVVVPGKALNEISKILTGEADKEVTIYFTDRHILFEFDDTVVLSRLIEGEYFKIDQMLSNDYETKVKINKNELYGCIDRATLLLREAEKKPVILHIKEDEIQMEMNTKIGSMDEEVTAEKEGKDLVIAFNPKYINDVLKVIDDEEVTLYLFNANAPCFIKNEEESYIYLILPVNMN